MPHVGLTSDQMHHIAKKGPAVTKASRRDLAMLAARGLDGATTVAATMLLAARAGIAVFVTGGEAAIQCYARGLIFKLVKSCCIL